jgi:hypothetical protein
MHAASRYAVEQLSVDALNPDAAFGSERQQFLDPPAAALTDANRGDAPGAQRLEHRIDPVNDHFSRRPFGLEANRRRITTVRRPKEAVHPKGRYCSAAAIYRDWSRSMS